MEEGFSIPHSVLRVPHFLQSPADPHPRAATPPRTARSRANPSPEDRPMLRVRRLPPALLLGALVVSLSACGKSNGPGKSDKPDAVKVETGAELYSKVPLPKAAVRDAGAEPIIAPQAVMQFDQKIQIPAEVDGRLEIIGSPLPAETKYDPADASILRHPRDQTMLFRKLQETHTIRIGQLLARIDESQVTIQRDANVESLKAFDFSIVQSKEVVKAAQDVADRQKALVDNKTVSAVEYAQTVASLRRRRVSSSCIAASSLSQCRTRANASRSAVQ